MGHSDGRMDGTDGLHFGFFFFFPFSHGVVVRGRIGWVGSFSYPRFGVLLLLFSLLFRWTGHLSPTARVRSCIRFGLLLFHFHISTHTPCRLWFVPWNCRIFFLRGGLQIALAGEIAGQAQTGREGRGLGDGRDIIW